VKQLTLSSALRLAFVFCLVLFLANLAPAQNTNSGDIRGTVTDPARPSR